MNKACMLLFLLSTATFCGGMESSALVGTQRESAQALFMLPEDLLKLIKAHLSVFEKIRFLEFFQKGLKQKYTDSLGVLDESEWREQVKKISQEIRALRNNLGYTVLEALNERNYALFTACLEAKANIHIKDSDNTSALSLAVMSGKKDFVYALLKCGAQPNEADNLGETPLTYAICCNNLSLVKLLIQYHADLSYQNKQKRGRTPLMALVTSRNKDDYIAALAIADLLIKSGAQLDQQDYSNATALLKALEEKKLDLAKFLLEKGASWTIPDLSGLTSEMLIEIKMKSAGKKAVQALHTWIRKKSQEQAMLEESSVSQ